MNAHTQKKRNLNGQHMLFQKWTLYLRVRVNQKAKKKHPHPRNHQSTDAEN